jgi:geranylgeranyl diphosphate synthase, type II
MPSASPFSLAAFAEHTRRRVDAALEAYTASAPDCPDDLRAAMQYSLLAPGKRLRPMLALMAAEACAGEPNKAISAACAVEMVHAYSLIHDDLPAMDNDDLRRGRPTCHRKFNEALAILAGDALLTLAFQILAQGIRPPETAAACCGVLAQAAGACNLVGGQADDLRGFGPGAGLEALESIHLRKTGALIRASLQLGAMAVGADSGQLAALDQFGRALGLAFQITDDLLDVRGEESRTGKRVGKDSACGKLTYPGLLGVDRSLLRAEQLVADAQAALSPFAGRAVGLEALAAYVLERDR